jgi:hypothetical protein
MSFQAVLEDRLHNTNDSGVNRSFNFIVHSITIKTLDSATHLSVYGTGRK